MAKRSPISATAELLLFSQLAYRRGTVIVHDKFKLVTHDTIQVYLIKFGKYIALSHVLETLAC